MNEDVQDLLVWEALAEGGGGEGGGRGDGHQEEHQDTASHPAPLLHETERLVHQTEHRDSCAPLLQMKQNV